MSRRTLIALIIGGAALLVAGFVGVVVATSGSSSDGLVLYSARSHYGEEKPFEDFAKKTGTDLTIRGGDASELYERLSSEGKDTPADVLITVDAANLWRAQHAGLIDSWKPLTLRARTIMRSTERVGPNDVTTYEGLGDPRWKGKLCLRSGTSEYNVSFVADRPRRTAARRPSGCCGAGWRTTRRSSARTPTFSRPSRMATATWGLRTRTTSGVSSPTIPASLSRPCGPIRTAAARR